MKTTLSHLPALFTAAAGIAAAIPAYGQVNISHIDRAAMLQTINGSTPENARARSLRAVVSENNKIDVLITIAGDETINALEAEGFEPDGRVGLHLYGKAPADRLEAIASCEGVTAFSLARNRSLRNDKARYAGNVAQVQSGDGLELPYNGAGVVAAITDMGLDPNHITFKDSEGNTRVKRLWNYSGRFPVSYDDTNITSFSTDDRDETHGTHVLGTMAGSCTDSESGNDYHGVAPEAEIAIVCGSASDNDLLDGIKRITEYAASQNKPVVINMSLGDNFGPHDGSDTFTSALNELAAETPIFVAAGNEGASNVALVTELTEEKNSVMTLMSANDYTTSYYGSYGASYFNQGVGYIDVWSQDEKPLKVYLDVVSAADPDTPLYTLELGDTPAYVGNGTTYRYFISGRPESGTAFDNYYTNAFMGGYTEVNKANGRFNATVIVFLESSYTSFYNTFVALRVEGEPGQKAYIYNDGHGVDFTSRNLSGYSNATPDGSISNMACGPNTISVGAYISRNSIESRIGQICDFSSWGVLHDGRELPDIVAPGSSIISALSSQTVRSPNYNYYLSQVYPKTDTTIGGNATTYYWTSIEGTSMATPFAAGVGALLLDANPNLTPADIRSILKESATAPDFAQTWWGAGKINALEAIKAATQMNSLSEVSDNGNGNITINPDGANRWQIFAPGETRINVDAYTPSGIHALHLECDGDTVADLNSLQEGIYLVTVTGAKSCRSVKVAVR